MRERLENAVTAWLERVLADDKPDVAAFAAEHGVSVAELAPLLDNARWLVGRHREQRAGDRLPTPPFDLGDVRVLEEAGRGGMGVVFRGVQQALQRPVAVKVLDPARHDAGSRGRARFLREAQAAARLRHPNIVAVLVVGETDGLAWFAMEWIEGESLAQVLARRRAPASPGGASAPREAARLIAKVARALQHAHENGLLHRDVKPGNILVDGDGEPHLADFGLVRDLIEPGLTATGEVLGSPPYMSPEQVRGERALTPRTDVYSLGVTLYECLTRNRPFRADDTAALRAQILTAPVPLPRADDPRIPEELQWICLRAMARESSVRYPSAAAFAADLEAFLRGEPTHAGPPSLPLRLQRWLRRHRRALVLAGAGLVLSAAAALGWQARASLRRAELRATRDRVALARITEDRTHLLRVLDDAIERHPSEAVFLLQRAIPRLASQRLQDAAADVARARALCPDDAEVADVVNALATATAIATGEPPTDAQEAALAQVARVAGERADLLHLRGVLLACLGRFDAAEPLLQRARTLDRSLGVEADLMVAHLRLGNAREAWADLERFTASRDVPSLRFMRCRLLTNLADVPAAIAERAKLEHEVPASAFTAGARIIVSAYAAETVDIAAELARARQAGDWDEAESVVLRAAADAHHLRQQPAEAIAAYELLLARDVREPSLHSVLGVCCFQLAERQSEPERSATLRRGRQELECAVQMSRHLPFECDYHAGMFAFFTGKWADAVDRLRAGATKAPGDPKRQRPLAVALAKLADTTAEPAARLSALRECAAVHRTELRLCPSDARAGFLLRRALERLGQELEREGDPEAAAVLREASTLADAPRR